MAFLTRRVGLAIVSALIGALAFGSQGPSPAFAQGRDVVVFAAASMKNALDEINQAWSRENGGRKATISYAASSALAKQIEEGAPADLFASADLDWMDYAQQEPDPTRDALEPARQPHRADRAEGR